MNGFQRPFRLIAHAAEVRSTLLRYIISIPLSSLNFRYHNTSHIHPEHTCSSYIGLIHLESTTSEISSAQRLSFVTTMRLAECIASAMLFGLSMAFPMPPPTAVTLTQTIPGMPISTVPSAMPINTPMEMMPPAITPNIHKIVTDTHHHIPDPSTTGTPVPCELVPCTSTAFWHNIPLTKKGDCTKYPRSRECRITYRSVSG